MEVSLQHVSDKKYLKLYKIDSNLVNYETEVLENFDSKKLRIKTKKTNKITLISGPYKSINLMKNDYIQLKNYGFEELDLSINE